MLYRNNGDGTFTDVTRKAGLLNEAPRWGAGCTFLDYNRDGNLDLFVSNYVQFDLKRVPKPGQNGNCIWKDVDVECGPRGLPHGLHSALSQQWRRHFHRRQRASPEFRRSREVMA